QIELDRRMVGERIRKLEAELEIVRKQRDVQRKQRRRKPVPNAAIVGYTNAGKSTILNHMTGAEVLAADKLFATLDPTTKPIILPNQQTLLLTDTVGFIRKLPHQLVESFKATLEESVIADFLLHVVDISSPHLFEHYQTTLEVLHELGVDTKTMIPVFNKIDKLADRSRILEVKAKYPDAVFISSLTGEGIDSLQYSMARILDEKLSVVELKIPVSRFDLVSLIHRTCDVKEENYEYDFVYMKANVIPAISKEIKEYIQ
ncbi:MAG: GTPase HflX, partial [Lentisphaeria bacterium]